MGSLLSFWFRQEGAGSAARKVAMVFCYNMAMWPPAPPEDPQASGRSPRSLPRESGKHAFALPAPCRPDGKEVALKKPGIDFKTW